MCGINFGGPEIELKRLLNVLVNHLKENGCHSSLEKVTNRNYQSFVEFLWKKEHQNVITANYLIVEMNCYFEFE